MQSLEFQPQCSIDLLYKKRFIFLHHGAREGFAFSGFKIDPSTSCISFKSPGMTVDQVYRTTSKLFVENFQETVNFKTCRLVVFRVQWLIKS